MTELSSLTPFLDSPKEVLVFSFSPSFNSHFLHPLTLILEPSHLLYSVNLGCGAQESFAEHGVSSREGLPFQSFSPHVLPVPPMLPTLKLQPLPLAKATEVFSDSSFIQRREEYSLVQPTTEGPTRQAKCKHPLVGSEEPQAIFKAGTGNEKVPHIMHRYNYGNI